MTQGVECDRVVELPPLSASPHLDTALFMMETSGGSTLTPRQACGVESAARKVAVILITIYCCYNVTVVPQSGLHVHLLVMSGSLDLRDNTTCWLASSSASLPLSIHSVNLTSLAHQTPLQVRCQKQSTQHKESFLY